MTSGDDSRLTELLKGLRVEPAERGFARALHERLVWEAQLQRLRVEPPERGFSETLRQRLESEAAADGSRVAAPRAAVALAAGQQGVAPIPTRRAVALPRRLSRPWRGWLGVAAIVLPAGGTMAAVGRGVFSDLAQRVSTVFSDAAPPVAPPEPPRVSETPSRIAPRPTPRRRRRVPCLPSRRRAYSCRVGVSKTEPRR